MAGEDVTQLTQLVLWSAFVISMGFGALVQRTGFCTMGAITDAATMGDWTRLRQWALAAGVAMAGFALLVHAGQIDPARTLWSGHRWLWLSALTGGLVFGFGMVLSSGCASKALVRIGGGNLKSVVVALVVGVSGFATLRGLTAVWRVETVDRVSVDLGTDATLSALAMRAMGLPLDTAALLIGLGLAAALVAWALASAESRCWPNLAAGIGVGATVVAMWWVTGHLGHVAEHPDTLEDTFLATNSMRAEALNFVSPIAYGLDWVMFYSDTNKRLTVGIVSVLGVICGSAAVAVARRSFRWEGFGNTSDLAHHLAGGVLMGVGGVTAMGCSIGQGVSGVSTLNATSFVALLAMLAGGVAGARYQEWRLTRD